MNIGPAIRLFGWTGFLAGLFGFVLMGALGGPRVAAPGAIGATMASNHSQVHHAIYAHGDSDHAHHHGHVAEDGVQHEPVSPDGSGGCLDHCCGAACHILSGRIGMLARLFVAPTEVVISALEIVRENDHLMRIDRPPRG